jgi:hypothetical protein
LTRERLVDEICKLEDWPDTERLVEEVAKLKDRSDAKRLIEEIKDCPDRCSLPFGHEEESKSNS